MRRKFACVALAVLCSGNLPAADLHLNDLDYFESQGLSVLAYQNLFHDVFRDQKLGGIEIIQHGERIATDGEVRLLPTPEQWDPVPKFTGRKHGAVPDQLIAASVYPDLHFTYRIEVTAEGEGFRIAVHLDQPLPAALVGKAGFNSQRSTSPASTLSNTPDRPPRHSESARTSIKQACGSRRSTPTWPSRWII